MLNSQLFEPRTAEIKIRLLPENSCTNLKVVNRFSDFIKLHDSNISPASDKNQIRKLFEIREWLPVIEFCSHLLWRNDKDIFTYLWILTLKSFHRIEKYLHITNDVFLVQGLIYVCSYTHDIIHIACTYYKQVRFIANTASKIKVTSGISIQH